MSTAHPRWGILGTARHAGTIIAAIRAIAAGEIVAVASRDLGRSRAFAATHGIPRAHAGYEQLLADPGVDVVYIPLPAALHARWAIAAIQQGKHVLVEKPFAMDAVEAEAVFAAAAARGLAVGEAFMCLFHPLTQRMRALVRAGAVGTPRLVRSSFAVTIAPADDIRWQAEAGGGALRDLGCYCVGISRYLLGEEPASVAASASLARGVDAEVAGTLRFPSGALASFACSMDAAFECSYEVIGSSGRLRVDRGGMVAWPGTAFSIGHWQGDQFREEAIAPADHYQLMIASFAERVRSGAPYGIAASDTIATMRTLDQLLACLDRQASAPSPVASLAAQTRV
jgi:xylose dehydrogenase (NAD/NADP)